MANLVFQPFDPSLDPAVAVMIDGHAPGFRTISHWPGHRTPAPLRHDLTTGSALLFAEMSEQRRHELMGDFSVITNNHYDTDGALSLFAMLRPDVALRHKDVMLRTARSGDFAVWCGADALALELSIMADLGAFQPFTTPPFDAERVGNLSRAYVRIFERLEGLLVDPYALRSHWEARYEQVTADVARIEAGEGIQVEAFPDDDLAIVETDRPITGFGLRLAAGDCFRVLLVHPGPGGNRYRFCFRNETWWDVVSVHPQPRVSLRPVAERLNALEPEAPHWWASPDDWVVPELGHGAPVAFPFLAVRFDPLTDRDPASALPLDVVVRELRSALSNQPSVSPVAASDAIAEGSA